MITSTFILGILMTALAYSRGRGDGKRAGIAAEKRRVQAEQDARVAKLMADIRRRVEHMKHSPVPWRMLFDTDADAAQWLVERFGGCAHTVEGD